jgi:hypothetical protein
MRKIYLSITGLLMIFGCESLDFRFTIKNESKSTISFYISKDSSFKSASIYFSNIKEDWPYIQSKKIYHVPAPSNWENNIESEFKDSTMNVFFIDSITIGKNKNILSNNIKRYRIKLKEIKKSNWVFTYR